MLRSYQDDSAADGENVSGIHQPAIPANALKRTSWSPGASSITYSLDENCDLQRPHQQPSPSSGNVAQRCPNSSTSCEGSQTADPPQPQAILDMDVIQAQAEMLEMQTRRELREMQRLAEQHCEEMLDSKGYRVTHACEHCRQRKAKCSGQQPCSRCAKQGILCIFSKHDQKGKAVRRWFDVSSQSFARIPTLALPASASTANLGPIRATGKTREKRYANTSTPYGLRRNTLPCSSPSEFVSHLRQESAAAGSSTQPVESQPSPCPTMRELRSAASFPPLQAGMSSLTPQLFTPMMRSSTEYTKDQRRSSAATDGSESFDPMDTPPVQTRFTQPHRPWTAESSLSQSSTDAANSAARFQFPLPARSTQESLDWNNSSRVSAPATTFDNHWTGQIPLLPVASSSAGPSRQTFQAAPYRPPFVDQHVMQTGSTFPDEQRYRSWSIDGNSSQDMSDRQLSEARQEMDDASMQLRTNSRAFSSDTSTRGQSKLD